jgi:hypothetical protein
MYLLSSAVRVQPVRRSGALRLTSRQRAQRRWMGGRVRLVKVCPCVRVSDAIRLLSGECRIRRVSTGRSASMAQGHRLKSEWPSEALSDARRPHSGRFGRCQKVRGRLECDALDMQARSARRWSLAWLASSPSRQRKPMSSTSASAHPPASTNPPPPAHRAGSRLNAVSMAP